MISREWYRFFLTLFQLTGSGTSDTTISDLQITPPPVAPVDSPDYALWFAASAEREWGTTDVLVPSTPPTTTGNAPALLPRPITVTASPFTYQNTAGSSISVIVSGGTVSAIEFTRDNATFYTTGAVSGMIELSPYDQLRVTYAVAPTMTLIPR